MDHSGSLDELRAEIAVAASLYMVRRTQVRRNRSGDADIVRSARPKGEECRSSQPTLVLRKKQYLKALYQPG